MAAQINKIVSSIAMVYVLALFCGVQKAQAQLDCSKPPGCTALEWRDYLDEQDAKRRAQDAIDRGLPQRMSDAHQQLLKEWNESRSFANLIYQTAFEGIEKTIKEQGKDAALALSQNPHKNPALVALVKKARDGQYLMVALILSDAAFDAPRYINGYQEGDSPSLSDQAWEDLAARDSIALNCKSPSDPELRLLKHAYVKIDAGFDDDDCMRTLDKKLTKQSVGLVLAVKGGPASKGDRSSVR